MISMATKPIFSALTNGLKQQMRHVFAHLCARMLCSDQRGALGPIQRRGQRVPGFATTSNFAKMVQEPKRWKDMRESRLKPLGSMK